jgi:hypothetical protein
MAIETDEQFRLVLKRVRELEGGADNTPDALESSPFNWLSRNSQSVSGCGQARRAHLKVRAPDQGVLAFRLVRCGKVRRLYATYQLKCPRRS